MRIRPVRIRPRAIGRGRLREGRNTGAGRPGCVGRRGAWILDPTNMIRTTQDPVRVAGASASDPPVRRQSRWRALVNAASAVRSTDPATVEAAVQELAGKGRWLKPLAYAAGTVAVVFDGVLLLIRHWRLTLLQLVPAMWIWVMSWNLRSHVLAESGASTAGSIAIAVGILLTAQTAYWCNATFGYTMVHGGEADIRSALAEARPHWRLVGGLALLTGGVQAAIAVGMAQTGARWLTVALLVMFVVQIYLFIAIPSWLVGARKTGTRRERLVQTLTTGVLSGVAATPGFLLNRIGLLLLGTSALWIVGIVVLSIGAVLHVTASSSVRVVKFSLRLRPEQQEPPAAPS